MKAIRIVTLAIALCAAGASVGAAQGQSQGVGRGAGAGGMLLRDITLTDAQKVQQKAIREKYAPKLLSIRKYAETTGMPEDDASRVKMLKIQAEQAAELRAILTAEQQTVFDRNIAEIRAQREERERNG
jgi:Spy/CpxP family protein refolding chaperone